MMPAKIFRYAFATIVLCSLPGCVGDVNEAVSGDAKTFTFDRSLVFPEIAVSAGLLVAGFVMSRMKWEHFQMRGYLLMVAAPLLAVSLVPNEFTRFVRTDHERFEACLGNWFYPDRYDVRFDDLTRVGIAAKPRKKKGQTVGEEKFLVLENRDGTKFWVELNNLVRAAVPHVMQAAQARGISTHNSAGN